MSTSEQSGAHPAAKPAISARTRLAAIIVAVALFMQNLDSTILATALPVMARAFGADPVHMSAALTSYLVSLAVFIPASGWMADRYGSRTVFRAAVGIFTLGSILCGLSGSLWFLILARVIQGMGGAMMVPVGRLVLLRSTPKAELVVAMTWLTLPAMLGPLIGPPLGGFIVTYTSWRWIFGINVPIGVLGMALVTRYLDDVREPGTSRLDLWGLVLSGILFSCLVFASETAGRGVVPPTVTVGMLLLALIAGLAYARHAQRVTQPVLDFRLVRIPTFGVAVIAGTFFRTGIGAMPFLTPLMIQVGFGKSAAQSGLITFSGAVGALLIRPVARSMLRRLGFRTTLLANGLVASVLVAACALFRPSWPPVAIAVILFFGGVFRSVQFTSYNTLAFADVPPERMSAATSLFSTLQQVSMTFGIAIGAMSLEISTALGGRALPNVTDFSIAFTAVGLMTMIAAPLTWGLDPDAGAEMSGHQASPVIHEEPEHVD